MEQQPTQLETTLLALLEKMGLRDDMHYDAERRHVGIVLEDEFVNDKNLPLLVSDFNHVVQLFAKKYDQPPVYVDVNHYQKKREELIVELARAAARKAVMTQKEVVLPVMNSYERRLVHVELAVHPDVKTESVGSDKARCVAIRPVSLAVASEQQAESK